MAFLEKAIATVAPRYALKRAHARLKLLDLEARYDGATGGRRGNSFKSSLTSSANTEIGSRLTLLRARSREMVRDHWAFSRILQVMTSHVIGSGINIVPDNGSDRIDKQCSLMLEEWMERADVTGELNFHGLTALAFRSMLEGGDVIFRMLDMGARDERSVPFALQLCEGDIIDSSRDAALANARTNSRLGVELGPLGQRVGYWLFPNHPGEMNTVNTASTLRPYADTIHLMQPLRPGQVRGVPIFSPVLLPARDLADLVDAVVMKAKIEACFSVFVKKTGDISPFDDRQSTVDGMRFTELSPGLFTELREGEDVTFADPSSNNSSFKDINNSQLYAMAAGAGITFDQLTGDLTNANYSSLRAGKIEFRRIIEQLQWNVIIPRIHRRVVDAVTERATMVGELRERAEPYRWEFVPPANEPIDPMKDLQADILAVRAGRMSPQEFISGWGRDWKKVVRDQAEFFKLIDELKITLDIDPRKTNQSGSNQVKDTTATTTE
jgi:lambda family phage portal protein